MLESYVINVGYKGLNSWAPGQSAEFFSVGSCWGTEEAYGLEHLSHERSDEPLEMLVLAIIGDHGSADQTFDSTKISLPSETTIIKYSVARLGEAGARR